MQSIVIIYLILISILLWLKLSPGSPESSSALGTTTPTAGTAVNRIPQDSPKERTENIPKTSTKVSKLLNVLKGSPARDNLIADSSTPASNVEETTFDCYSLYGDDCYLLPDSIGPRLSAKLLKILAKT